MNGSALLRALPDACVAAVFFDPQYRAVMNKQRYGDEAARQKRRAALPQQDDMAIARFVESIERVLKPHGHLFFWTDKFTAGSAIGGRPLPYFVYAPALRSVDLFHWNPLRFGMGARGRGASEYLLVKQKPPIKSKGIWTDKTMRDSWTEMADRDLHPHAKPYQLIERLIRATTKIGDLVADPCAGSFVVLEACRVTRREFVGCDLLAEEDDGTRS